MSDKTDKEGASVLHSLNPTKHFTDIVESSVRQEARKTGKMPGNAEEKLGSFIGRLSDMQRNPEQLERLREHIENELVMKAEDVPESYWQLISKLARDNGQDSHISESQKKQLTRQLQDAQRTSVQSWTQYLEQEAEQYPTWFKVYALEGMASMSNFNKDKGMYNKRSQGTVAPYPQLNPAVLAKTYDQVAGAFWNHEGGLQTVSFNKVYSRHLLETHTLIPTPERPEDVQGVWHKYDKHDLKKIVRAAQGTPWCIAGKSMAKTYTRGGDNFYFFHLIDPETGLESQTASVSVRLERSGSGDDTLHVAEISGLKGGSSQYLEDALVPTVMEKIATLPGGEDYVEAFEDKQKLINMDRKFQVGEDFTIEELRFLYELDRQIKYIDTYVDDPRPEEFKKNKERHYEQFKEAYGIYGYLALVEEEDMPAQIKKILEDDDPTPEEVDNIVSLLSFESVEDIFGELLSAGADPKIIAARIPKDEMSPYFVKELSEVGIDIEELAAQVTPQQLKSSLSAYLSAGVSPNRVIETVGNEIGSEAFMELIYSNADPTLLAKNISIDLLERNTGLLLNAGADPNIVGERQVKKLDATLYRKLKDKGATLDINEVIREVDSNILDRDYAEYLELGADPRGVFDRTNVTYTGLSTAIDRGIKLFINAGIDPNEVLNKANSAKGAVMRNFAVFVDAGVSSEKLISSASASDIMENYDLVTSTGFIVDPEVYFDRISRKGLSNTVIETFLRLGISQERIDQKLRQVEE